MRIPLIGGSFPSRSPIASTSQCINLYPEVNPDDALVPMTYYQRPGLVSLAQGPNAPFRGVYCASDGQGFGVIGNGVYYISPTFTLTKLGVITAGLTTPVSFADNGAYMILVDASNSGWQVNLSTHAFGAIAGFPGAVDVDFLDGYLLYASPSPLGDQWGCTLFNSLNFDPTYVAKKIGWPDPIQALMVNRREIMLFGTKKTEIWYNAGQPTFPFAELPGSYIEHGLVAPYAHTSTDTSSFWLAQNLQGQGVVMRQRGHEATRISNHALEWAMLQMPTISDAIAMVYLFSGHTFLMLQFPTANQTWVFDDSISDPKLAWHQENYIDAVGNVGRHRANCLANLYGQVVVGDYENGRLYSISPNAYTDNGQAIVCTRVFPHITQWPTQFGPVPIGDKRIKFDSFILDAETGTTGTDPSAPPMFSLAWSDDRGRTFGNRVRQQAGMQGQYLTQPIWRNLGIARDRIFRVDYSIPGPAALNGAFIEGELLTS